MSKMIETALVLKRENKFDKIRKNLLFLFFKKEYIMMEQIDNLLMPKRPNKNNIVIPKEIRKKK